MGYECVERVEDSHDADFTDGWMERNNLVKSEYKDKLLKLRNIIDSNWDRIPEDVQNQILEM